MQNLREWNNGSLAEFLMGRHNEIDFKFWNELGW